MKKEIEILGVFSSKEVTSLFELKKKIRTLIAATLLFKFGN